jgi:hypothetical protein
MVTPWDRDSRTVWRTPSLWPVTAAAAATRPFVRYVHIGHASGKAGIDYRAGLPGERPDRGQDHPDAGDRFGQRRRVGEIDGAHVGRRALGG